MSGFFHFYRKIISPALHSFFGPGAGCRFEPTCSLYAEESLRVHGWVKGSGLAVKRLCACNPWQVLGGRSGWDPVPARLLNRKI